MTQSDQAPSAPECPLSTIAPMESPETDRPMSDVVAASLTAYGANTSGVRLAHTDSHARATPGPADLLRREGRETNEAETLAPGATRAVGAGNRAVPEEPDEWRTCFERDLDRIKYSRPFRRLSGKCQVFLAPDDIHLRNRMTHAIEVAQVALAIARPARLNLTLVEAIALGHDCGHGPAGHASEDAFSQYMPSGDYDHAVYGADVTLAPLNLCAETLEGIRQHSWRLAAPSTPEAEVVSWADRIAYVAHDADDAIRAGIIHAGELPELVRERCGTRQSAQIGTLVRGMLDAIETTGKIGMVEDVAVALDEFRRFNYDRIYLRPAAQKQATRVISMLSALVEFFADAPGRVPDVATGKVEFPTANSPEAFETSIDYVSGMTDRYAIDLARDLLGWRSEALPRGV